MAKLVSPLTQAAINAEEFAKVEREKSYVEASYERGLLHHLGKALKDNKLALLCLVILCIIILSSVFAFLSPYDPDAMDVMLKMAPPSADHWFGTDELGRDSFTRALYGGRVSLTVGFAAMVVSVIIGTTVGSISGYVGGSVDAVLMRIVDIFQPAADYRFLLLRSQSHGNPCGHAGIVLLERCGANRPCPDTDSERA